MMCCATFDPQLISAVVHLAGVTCGASKTDPIALPAAVGRGAEFKRPLRESDGQPIRIVGRVPRLDQEAQSAQMTWRGEQLLTVGLLERQEPFVGHEDGSLAREVPPIGRITTPALIEISYRTLIFRLRGDTVGWRQTSQ